MLMLTGDTLQLSMANDGTGVVLEDLRSGTRWCLDESTRLASREISRAEWGLYAAEAVAQPASRVAPLGGGRAEMQGDDTILVAYDGVTLRWVMAPDRLRVIAEAGDGISSLTLPGTFRPAGETFLSAVPNCQGVLHTGKGPAFFRTLHTYGHSMGYTMPMFGQLAARGGLLTICESDDEVMLHWEKTAAGEVRLMWLALPSFQRLAYPREVVLMATAPALTDLCKTFRRYEIEHGRFKSWREKVAERPQLEQLFGAAIVFLGYMQDPELDYAESFRKLKAAGIDRAYVYPVYCDSTLSIKFDLGMQSIDVRRHVPLLHELGYLAGSFIYLMDGPAGEGDNPFHDQLLDQAGNPVLFWQMRELKWYILSNEARRRWMHHFLDREHAGLDGMHYDVLCCTWYNEDYHPAHTTDARADAENRRHMLEYAGRDNGLLVSSEGFKGRMTPYYDLGNTKYQHALGGEEYCVVPMTMLVYHDSAYQTWWEVDNYNNPEHRAQGERGFSRRYWMGGGYPQLQSAMDALMGTPPDIFPFGLMYAFVPHNQPDVYPYRIRFEDPRVQEAIACAKPVMALHARIGMLELVEHILHTPDGAVQETVFADGTRVIANFANVAVEVPGVGVLQPESWVER